jgi:hypothetical protein
MRREAQGLRVPSDRCQMLEWFAIAVGPPAARRSERIASPFTFGRRKP